MKWNYLGGKVADSGKRSGKEDIVLILLENRGIRSEKARKEFLNPPDPRLLTADRLGIDVKQLDKAIKRIQNAIKNKEPIVVYGDYDVDGICSTAILWETLRDLGASAMPFIPQREKEGYGLSIEGIKTILEDEKYNINKFNKNNKANKLNKKVERGLLITVDNGIVAHEAVDFANDSGLDVIIIDHHEVGKTLPKTFAIVHTLELCAAGITYFFFKELYSVFSTQYSDAKILELACIATVADLVPLAGPNRSIVKYGLEALNNTKRTGLLALFEIAGIKKVGTYEIGYLIGPRINASGRIDSALVGLRLLCTPDKNKANEYATQLNEINKERQGMVEEMVAQAFQDYELRITNYGNGEKIIILEHESYHQGVIGLIAGKLVERYYLPAIVIARGAETSKASARSISGFNIIEAIRNSNKFLLNAGGHPMAAGFSIETMKIADFRLHIAEYTKSKITDETLERSLKIDMELGLELVGMQLYEQMSTLGPYGIGNPEPVFASVVKVETVRTMGVDGKHLKLIVQPLRTTNSELPSRFEAVGFGMGKRAANLKPGDKIELAYCLSLNEYMGSKTLQLKIKDLKYGRID